MIQTKDTPLPPQPLYKFLLWRIGAVVCLALLVVVSGTALVLADFNANRYAPALVAALEQITGRQVTLSGPVTIQWSLNPAIEASGLAIGNPAGFSTPNVITIAKVRAEIALLPLWSHHVDILKLVLVQPHFTLEHLADGAANWHFSRNDDRPRGTLPFLSSHMKIALEAVEIEDGLLTVRANNRLVSIHFFNLTGTANSLSTPLHLNAEAEFGTIPFYIAGSVGPIERFSGIGSGPWPIHLDFAIANAHLDINGTINQPNDLRGYDLAVGLNIPDLSVIGPALPTGVLGGVTLPAVQNIVAAAHVQDVNGPFPAITGVSATVGQSDLSELQPSLALRSLNITMLALDQPLSLLVTGSSGSGKFMIKGQFGTLQSLLTPAAQSGGIITPPANFPVSLSIQLGDASASVTGGIATPQTLSGTALALSANIPDLSALSAVAGTPLPAWKHIALQTSLIDPGGAGLYNAAGFDGLVATMDNASLGGDATLSFVPQPKLQLALNVTQANLDALLAALPMPSNSSMSPESTVTSVIPDTPLPLGFLHWGNADIQLAADNVVWNGATYTALQANAQLSRGILTIDPLSGEIPGGDILAKATLDGSVSPVAEALSIKAPALALGPLFKSLNLTGPAEGNLQLQLAASTSGNTLHAMAANLSGQFGVAAVNAEVNTGVIDDAFGPMENADGLVTTASTSDTVRCFGILIDSDHGVATLKTLGLDSSQLMVQGSGTVDLGQERYKISLQPANGQPVGLSGSFAQPSWTVTAPTSGPTPLPAAPGTAPTRPDICPATLALARFGQPGPAAPPPTNLAGNPVSPPSIASPNAPKNLLNSLLTP